ARDITQLPLDLIRQEILALVGSRTCKQFDIGPPLELLQTVVADFTSVNVFDTHHRIYVICSTFPEFALNLFIHSIRVQPSYHFARRKSQVSPRQIIKKAEHMVAKR